MIAIDTNVVVRLLVADDAAQARKARALLAGGESVHIPASVLLEAESVLRAAYGFAPAQIEGFLRALLGLPGVVTDEPQCVARALAGYAQGLDFADALHLALSREATRFYSFNAALRRKAGRALPGVPVCAP